MPSFRTIAAPVSVEIDRIKGSRFIADAAPSRTESAAKAHLDTVRRTYPDATHHCYAWRLGPDHDAYRTSDDGEPGGTAGQPILRRIDGAGLSDVIVVVTRYFGGTKLGTGGLVRAYGAAAAAVLAQAQVLEVPRCQLLRVHIDYGLQGIVDGVLNAHHLQPQHARYGAQIELDIAVPLDDLDAVMIDLGQRCGGRARITTVEQADH